MTLLLAIFDVDGTIVDSRRSIAQAMDTAFAAVDLAPPGYDRTRAIVGLSLEEACRRLAPEDLSPAGLARLVDAYKSAFVAQRTRPDFDEPLYAGLEAVLDDLDRDGWLLAIATGKARRGLEAFFARHPGMAERFLSTHCACDGPGKPHPQMVLEALQASGARARDAVLVGDTTHDMTMAQAAKVRGVAVTWGFHTPDELAAGGADEMHDTPAALHAALARFAATRREMVG